MNNAALYKRSNGVQRRDAKQVLDEFGHLLQWRSDGRDSLLDIGCGSGDVLMDFILPLMPLKFSRLVGSDVSEQMVRHARDNFPHTKISFQTMDIAGNLNDLDTIELYDHITSFYCLHWVENQRQALGNIYDLLNVNGDCLVAFLASNPIFEIYKELAKSMKWAKYMNDVNRFISPYQYSKNPVEEFGKMLGLAGFAEHTVVVRDKLFVYDGLDILKSEYLFIPIRI